MSEKLNELQGILHDETLDLDKLNTSMRESGLPVASTSVDATAGASVTNFKEFQQAELVELSKMTPQEVQNRIRMYKFEIWTKTVKMQAGYSYLQNLASKLSKEEKAALKLTDVAFNPKELATPQKLSSKSNLTNEEKQAKDLIKVLPHLSMAEALEQIRKARGAAFQKGLTVGAGTPQSIDTCEKCKIDYPAGTEHKCVVAAPTMSMAEKVAALRAKQNEGK
jgi:hypothetical protein